VLRNLARYWPLVGIVAAAAFATLLVASPVGSDCQRYNTKAQSDAYAHCVQDASAESVAEYTKVLAALTLVLAVVGSAQMFYVVRADDTAAKAARVAERTLFYANRAYVDVGRMHNEWNQALHPVTGDVVRQLRFRVGITNRGNTPAQRFNLSCGTWQSLTAPTIELFHELDMGLGDGHVASHNEVLSVDFVIQEADVRKIYSGEERFWLFAHIAYRDVFEETPDHEFQMCWQLLIIADPDVAWKVCADETQKVPEIIRWIPDGTFTKST